MQSRLVICRVEDLTVDKLAFWMQIRWFIGFEKGISGESTCVSVVTDVGPVEEVDIVTNLHPCAARVVEFDEPGHGSLVPFPKNGFAAESAG